MMRQLFLLNRVLVGPGCRITLKNPTSVPKKTGAALYRGGSCFLCFLTFCFLFLLEATYYRCVKAMTNSSILFAGKSSYRQMELRRTNPANKAPFHGSIRLSQTAFEKHTFHPQSKAEINPPADLFKALFFQKIQWGLIRKATLLQRSQEHNAVVFLYLVRQELH